MLLQSISALPYVRPNPFRIVSLTERRNFLPQNFGPYTTLFENYVYVIAEKVLDDYKGGYWEFVYSPNDLPFLFLDGEGYVSVWTIFGTNETKLPRPLAGLTVTAQAILLLLERHGKDMPSEWHDKFCDLYHDLISTGHDMASDYDCSEAYFNLVD